MLQHLSLRSHQLLPQLLLQLLLSRRHRRPRSRCQHFLGLPVVRFSRHCQRPHSSRTHRRQSLSPSFHRHYFQGEEERGPYFSSRHSRQLQHSLLQMLTLLLLSRLPRLRTLFQAVLAREPRRQLHPQSVQIQQAVLTSSSHPSLRVHRLTTTTTMTQTASSPCHDNRISSSPFWCFDAKGGESQGELESGGG